MSVLLESTRAMTSAVDGEESRAHLRDLAGRLGEVTESSVLVVDADGRVLAAAQRRGHELREGIQSAQTVSDPLREILAGIEQVRANIRRQEVTGLLRQDANGRERTATVIPVMAAGRRDGSLVLLRAGGSFDDKDLALGEFAAVAIGATRQAASGDPMAPASHERVQTALQALSLSEAEAVWHILNELSGSEGIVVASRVADRAGITRSVIVNALRKLESAMLIHSRSLGMKGTYIKVLHPRLTEEVDLVRNRR